MLWGSGRRNNGLVARIRGAVLGQTDGLETVGGRRYMEGRVMGVVKRRRDTIDCLGGAGGGMGGVM